MPDLDWRAYSRSKGLTPLQAWLACQQAIPHRPTGQRGVTSPKSLDLIAEDEAMHEVIKATIDDAARSER